MKLDLVHVDRRGAHRLGHHDTVAGGAGMVGSNGVGEAGIEAAHQIEVGTESAGGEDDGLGVDRVVMGAVLGLDTDSRAILHQDLGGGGIQHDLDALLLGLFAELGDEVASDRASVLGRMQILMGGTAGGGNLGQRRADGFQPFHGFGAVLRQGGDQGAVVQLVAAVHGVLDELLYAAVGDAGGFLELGIGTVHAAGGLQAVAADHGHLFKDEDLRPFLGGANGRRQTGAAGPDDHNVTVEGHGCFLRRGGRFVGNFKGGGVNAGGCKGLGDGGFNGRAGHGRTGNAVNGDAVGRDNRVRELFYGNRADARRFILLQNGDRIDRIRVGLDLHNDIAVNALSDTGGRHSAVIGGDRNRAQGEDHNKRKDQRKVLLHGFSSISFFRYFP